MEDHFLHFVFLCFVALFPPVNPVGTAVIVGPYFHGLSEKERSQAAFMIALYCLILCIVSALIGGPFFRFFGISVPVVQMAGGVLIGRMGWNVLSAKDDDAKEPTPPDKPHSTDIRSLLFYPLAFPTTTGGGTIAVLLALSANSYDPVAMNHTWRMIALIVACVLMATLIYFCYYFAPTIIKKLGAQGQQVLNRLTGFLTFCVGLQIFINGVAGIIRLFLPHIQS